MRWKSLRPLLSAINSNAPTFTGKKRSDVASCFRVLSQFSHDLYNNYSKNEICSNPQGLDVGDGFRLIFDNNGYVGAAEFERALLAGPGVDPDLVPEKWVGNHYRWIVWKLASMDRMKFGDSRISR